MSKSIVMSSKWSGEKTAQFIKEYSKYPCLWNKTNPMYRDKTTRTTAILKIKTAMAMDDLTVSLIKNKICALRSTYNMELKKVYRVKKLGREYTPSLSWFKLMDSFLITGQKKRNSRVGLVPDGFSEDSLLSTDAKETIYTTLKNDSSPNSETSTIVYPTNNTVTILPAKSNTDKKNIIYRRISIDNSNADNNHETNSPQNATTTATPTTVQIESIFQNTPSTANVCTWVDSNNKINEFDLFSKSVAYQLQQLPLDIALELQSDIQSMITKKRVEVLRSNKHGNQQLQNANNFHYGI